MNPRTSSPVAMDATPQSARVIALSLSEKELQRHIIAAAEMLGWRVYHTFDSRRSQAGFPDLLMVRYAACTLEQCEADEHPTEAVAIELKRERGKVSPEQEVWLDLLGRLPGVKFAGVIRPSQWFAGELDDVLR